MAIFRWLCFSLILVALVGFTVNTAGCAPILVRGGVGMDAIVTSLIGVGGVIIGAVLTAFVGSVGCRKVQATGNILGTL